MSLGSWLMRHGLPVVKVCGGVVVHTEGARVCVCCAHAVTASLSWMYTSHEDPSTKDTTFELATCAS